AAQALVDLAVADVHGPDGLGAPLQEEIGKAPRGRPEVDAAHPPRIDAEGVERLLQLESAAADVGDTTAADAEGRVDRDEFTGLLHPPGPDEALAGHDQSLRAGTRLRQPALDEEPVDPLPLLPHLPLSERRSAGPSSRRAGSGPPPRSPRERCR